MGRYCAAAPYRASEKYRFRRKSVGSACRIMQLLHMFGVITSYANYLHLFSILGGIFRPSSLIPNGKYIKYVPSGPRLVVSKPAPLKSKRVAGYGASFVPSRSPRKGGLRIMSRPFGTRCRTGVPGLFVAVVFLCLDQDENTSGGQPKKIYGERPFFAAQISGQHTQCDPAYADRRQAQAHETR